MRFEVLTGLGGRVPPDVVCRAVRDVFAADDAVDVQWPQCEWLFKILRSFAAAQVSSMLPVFVAISKAQRQHMSCGGPTRTFEAQTARVCTDAYKSFLQLGVVEAVSLGVVPSAAPRLGLCKAALWA